jgi:hypothetical protein
MSAPSRLERIKAARDYIGAVAMMHSNFAKLNREGVEAPPSYMALFDKHGVACGQKIATDLPDLEKQACFLNSFNAVASRLHGPDFVYCEGYAIGRDLCIPIHHAWLVNVKTGDVIDRTPNWSGYVDTAYFGIPFRTDFLLSKAKESGWPSPVFWSERYQPQNFEAPVDQWKAPAPAEGWI